MRVSWLVAAVLLCACKRQAAPEAAEKEQPALVEATPAKAADSTATLRIERMVLRRADVDGGASEPGVLVRGQTVTVELDVVGARARLHGTVRLGGATINLEPAPLPRRPGPKQTTHVGWQFRVPDKIATGRQQLVIEVSEGDGVSSIHRQVLVR